MDLGSILLTAGIATLSTLLVVGLVGWLLVRQLRRALSPSATPATPVVDLDDGTPRLSGLTVLRDDRDEADHCTVCRHFNLEAGQRIAKSQPAFFAATAHLEPWEMARMRALEPNPEYERIEALMFAAAEAGAVDEARHLHDELLALNPGELEEDTSDLDGKMLGADWAQLGACSAHKELRFASDTCEKWSGR